MKKFKSLFKNKIKVSMLFANVLVFVCAFVVLFYSFNVSATSNESIDILQTTNTEVTSETNTSGETTSETIKDTTETASNQETTLSDTQGEQTNQTTSNTTSSTNNSTSPNNTTNNQTTTPTTPTTTAPTTSNNTTLETILNSIQIQDIYTGHIYTGQDLYNLRFAYNAYDIDGVTLYETGGLKVIADPYDAIYSSQETMIYSSGYRPAGVTIQIMYNWQSLTSLSVSGTSTNITNEQLWNLVS